jgi:hypothetical protein
MISVCCCSLNARYEVESLLRTLAVQGQGVDWELCVTLDDRVEDGSLQHFEALQKEFPNFKFHHCTEQDTLDYLHRLLEYYDKTNYFDQDLRAHLHERLASYQSGTLLDKTRQFLWMSSGRLYNQAVEISSGDILFITPGDFLYLFSLKRLADYVTAQTFQGLFYASPPAIWARCTNYDYDWLVDHVQKVHDGQVRNSKYRYDSIEVLRDYVRCPEHLMDIYLPDFRNNLVIPMFEAGHSNSMKRYCMETFQHQDLQHKPAFHGFHCMTRKAFDVIGGFSEEFYGRAFADDKMTDCGRRIPGGKALPPEFAVAWCGGYEIENRGPGLPKNWRQILQEKDPWFGKTIQPGSRQGASYLHEPLRRNSDMNKIMMRYRNDRPVRISRG